MKKRLSFFAIFGTLLTASLLQCSSDTENTRSAEKDQKRLTHQTQQSDAKKDIKSPKELFFERYPETHLIAKASLSSTEDHTKVKGEFRIYQTSIKNSYRFLAYVSGLKPNSVHGFHIHENGSCENKGKAAGDHYDPFQTKNHGTPQQGNTHAGDLGNLSTDSQGISKYERILLFQNKKRSDKDFFVNRAVIIHQQKDNFQGAAGNAGPRIACGVIQSHSGLTASLKMVH